MDGRRPEPQHASHVTPALALPTSNPWRSAVGGGDQTRFASLKTDALKIAAINAVVGFVWILFASRLLDPWLAPLVADPQALKFYESAFYILLTTCLIYLLVRLHIAKINRLQYESFEIGLHDSLSNHDASKLRHRALKIAATYSAIGFAWVLFSDAALHHLFSGTLFERFVIDTGVSLYILITACIVYCLVAVHVRRIREIEDMLGRTRGTLRHVLDLVPHMIYAKDWRGRYILCNEAFARAHGLSVEELLETGVVPQPGAAAPGLDDNEQQIVRGEKQTVTALEDFEDTGGQKRFLQTTKVAFRDNTIGRPAILGIALDITDRLRAQQALFEEKERAQVTLHSISDAVISTDAAGIIDYMNPAAEHLTGWQREAGCGRALKDVFRVADAAAQERISNPLGWALEEGLAIGLLDRNDLFHRNGQKFAIEDSAAPIRDQEGRVQGVVIVFRDVTETRRMARKMFHLATHDPLTGLVNRMEFERRLSLAVAEARAHAKQHVLCYLDLDQFKVVNDSAGHAAGDELLKQLTGFVSQKVRPRDCFARLGGDEFSLLMENCTLARSIEVAESLLGVIRDFRFNWKNQNFDITVSIGIVPINRYTQDVEQVMSQGDIACYTAKDLGRNRIHVYQKNDREFHQRQNEIVRAAGLTDALSQRRFTLYGQPVFRIDEHSHRAVYIEILLRLFDEDGHITMPKAFIPAAERYGIMTNIDRWVVHSALEKFAACRHDSDLGIAINLSGNSLNDNEFLEYLVDKVERTPVPAERICFEITETATVTNLERASEFINEIKRAGCQFALDDFGSGLSSFNYLKNLPVDMLKIDGNFVSNMGTDRVDHAMVDAINKMGNVMGIQVVAECADDVSVIDALRRLGVNYVQGWYFAEAKPLDIVFDQYSRGFDNSAANSVPSLVLH